MGPPATGKEPQELKPQHSPSGLGGLRGESSPCMGPGVGRYFQFNNKCSFLLYS